MVTAQELNRKVKERYGRSIDQLMNDTGSNLGCVYEWLKRQYSGLSRREYGRVIALLEREFLYRGIKQ